MTPMQWMAEEPRVLLSRLAVPLPASRHAGLRDRVFTLLQTETSWINACTVAKIVGAPLSSVHSVLRDLQRDGLVERQHQEPWINFRLVRDSEEIDVYAQ